MDVELGRFVSRDPIAFRDFGVRRLHRFQPIGFLSNLYFYASGNPALFLDPPGLAPGDPFGSKDEAATDWAFYYNGASITENREYGSYLYFDEGNSSWTYTPAVTGAADSITADQWNSQGGPPPNTEGRIHSHAAYDPALGEGNEIFSGDDLQLAAEDNADHYLATPEGTLQKLDNKTQGIRQLPTSIPSDPGDPNRTNNIPPDRGVECR